MPHPDAEIAVAKAACNVGTIASIATGASKKVDEISAVATGPLWYQVYHKDTEVTQYLLNRA